MQVRIKMAVAFISLFAGIVTLCLIFSTKQSPVKFITGKVTSIYEAGTKETIFKISGVKGGFCLKKDFFKKINLKELKQQLVGQQVTIRYIDQWTPLDPASNKQVASIALGEELMYTEHE